MNIVDGSGMVLCPSGLDFLFGLVDDDGDDDRGTHDDLIITGVDGENDEGVVDELDDDGAEDGSDDGASATHERCAADDGGGDDLELVGVAGVGFGGSVVAEVGAGGEPAEGTGDGVDEDFDALDRDSGVFGGGFVAADGEDAAAKDRFGEYKPAGDGGEDHEDDQDGVDAEELGFEESCGEGGGEAADGLGVEELLGDDDGEASEDGHHAQGDDEGVDAEAFAHGAVGKAAEGSDGHAYEQGQGDSDEPSRLGGKIGQDDGSDDGTEAIDGADREVDACEDDDAGHAYGDDGEETRVGGDEDQV